MRKNLMPSKTWPISAQTGVEVGPNYVRELEQLNLTPTLKLIQIHISFLCKKSPVDAHLNHEYNDCFENHCSVDSFFSIYFNRHLLSYNGR